METNRKRRFKVWLAWKCLGEPEEVAREVEYVYAELWPKHDAYEAKTKLLLKESFLRLLVRPGGHPGPVCHKCGKPMLKIAERGEGNGPNGGWLCVFEETREARELFNGDIEMWKCSCGASAFLDASERTRTACPECAKECDEHNM